MAEPTLPDLRRLLGPSYEGHPYDAARRLALGVPLIDDALAGGLPLGAVHELYPSRPLDHGAVAGFAAALAALLNKDSNKTGRHILWIQHDYAAIEAGSLYGADPFGLPLASVVMVHVPRVIDALWALEEALKSRAVAAVIADIADDDAVSLTATRRLSLAARDGGGLGLLLCQRPTTASASATRWEVASAASARDQFGGLGPATFALSLVKNRCGPCGRWIIAWDHHERAFLTPALSLGVAQTARDRSARAHAAHAA